MRTTELRSLSFPELETRKPDSQNTRTAEDSHDFIAILQSVQRDIPQEEPQGRPEGLTEQRKGGEEEFRSSEEAGFAPKNEIPEEVVEDLDGEGQYSEELGEDSESSKTNKVSMDDTKIGEVSLSEAGTSPIEPDVDLVEMQPVGQMGLSLISLMVPNAELEHKEEIFQSRISAPQKESLLPPKEKFSSEEKKETNELLKTLFEGKNQKPKQEEKQVQVKSSEEQTKTPIHSARAVLEEIKNGTGSPKLEESFKFNSVVQNINLEDEGISGKKIKSSNRIARISENVEKKPEEVVQSKNFHKEVSFTQKNQGIDTVSITEKLKRVEMPSRKEKEQSPSQAIQQPVDSSIPRERSASNFQISENRLRSPETKTEVRNVAKTPETSRNFQEIVKAARFQIVENGKNSAEILLQPKELGKITLLVSEENSRLEGKILVETDSAKQMILGDLQNLKADLKSSGLELFELTVDIQEDNSMKFTSSDEKREEGKTGYNGSGTENLDAKSEEPILLSSDRILDVKV